MMTRSILALSAALALAACGGPAEEEAAETETAPAAPDFSEEIAEDLAALDAGAGEPEPGDWNETPWSDARSVFNQMCRDRGMDDALCGCIRNNLRAEFGADAVFVTGVTFGARADLAPVVTARLTAEEREAAAAGYLEANRTCLAEAGEE
ncbi:hypothetical protein [Euryhalocaulis caribicus]|uniref:hypothetical protein n=1 Tax=Euryhalocaulis caribicus TaxID=1161401 RepID=UPI00039DD488|nr:hypothetical protein [Euryhalocaulis caribicus]